jgi:metal-responsive CopG/Arc/MetJ family transcriptional regulator
MTGKRIRTTIALSENLLGAIDIEVRQGGVSSRNEFLAVAAQRELRRRENERIDAEIAKMADDEEYQREAAQIMQEFEAVDREAWSMLPPYEEETPEESVKDAKPAAS